MTKRLEPDFRLGLTGAIVSYLSWGLMPIYWNLLEGAGSVEVIAHRILWSLLFIPLVMAVRGKLRSAWSDIKSIFARLEELDRLAGNGLDRKRRAAACVAGLNWWINVIAVLSGHVVELGIGTFLTPLISVSCGVLFFHERLSRTKTAGVMLAMTGVLIMIVSFGHFPWISLGVSATWGIYGALKKKLMLDAWVSILLEALMMMPVAFGYVFWLSSIGENHFLPTVNPELSLCLAGTGIVASIPLIFFTIAAVNLPMNVLGFCQYISPILTLLLGILFFNERFGWGELFPLLFIWSGIAAFLFAEVREHRKAH